MRSCLGRIARFVSAQKVADGDMGCTGGGCVGRRSADMVRVSVDLRKKQQKAAATQPTEQDQVRDCCFFGRVSEEDARHTPPLTISTAPYLGGSPPADRPGEVVCWPPDRRGGERRSATWFRRWLTNARALCESAALEKTNGSSLVSLLVYTERARARKACCVRRDLRLQCVAQ